jgi:hypothetical protein
MCDWSTSTGDVRNNAAIATQILGFIEKHGALSIIMTDGIIGCPHNQGLITRASGAQIPRAHSVQSRSV